MRLTDSQLSAWLGFICTVKNGAQYIDDCLESLNTYYPSCDIVVVDDGSDDNSLELLRGWARRLGNLRVIETGGVGRGQALNIAIRESRRPYLSNIDIDDLVLGGRARIIQFMNDRGSEVAVAAGTSPVFTGTEPPTINSDENTVMEFINVSHTLHLRNPFSHVAVVMRRDALTAVDGYDGERTTQLDFDLWIRFANAGYLLFLAEYPVALKRLHPGQSYEHRDHFRYALNGAALRMSVNMSLTQRIQALAISVPRLLWATLPRWIRVPVMTTRRRIRQSRDIP